MRIVLVVLVASVVLASQRSHSGRPVAGPGPDPHLALPNAVDLVDGSAPPTRLDLDGLERIRELIQLHCF